MGDLLENVWDLPTLLRTYLMPGMADWIIKQSCPGVKYEDMARDQPHMFHSCSHWERNELITDQMNTLNAAFVG